MIGAAGQVVVVGAGGRGGADHGVAGGQQTGAGQRWRVVVVVVQAAPGRVDVVTPLAQLQQHLAQKFIP